MCFFWGGGGDDMTFLNAEIFELKIFGLLWNSSTIFSRIGNS